MRETGMGGAGGGMADTHHPYHAISGAEQSRATMYHIAFSSSMLLNALRV